MSKFVVLLFVLTAVAGNTVLTAGMVYLEDSDSTPSPAATCCLKIALVPQQTDDSAVSLDTHNSSTTTPPNEYNSENLPVKINMTSEQADRVNTLLMFIRNADSQTTSGESTLTFGRISLNLYQP